MKSVPTWVLLHRHLPVSSLKSPSAHLLLSLSCVRQKKKSLAFNKRKSHIDERHFCPSISTGRSRVVDVPWDSHEVSARCPSQCQQPITALAAGESLPHCFYCPLSRWLLSARGRALKIDQQFSLFLNSYLVWFVYRCVKTIWVYLWGLKPLSVQNFPLYLGK